MTDLQRFVFDRDYLVGPEALDVRMIAVRVEQLTSKKLFWNPDVPDLWFVDLTIDNFHQLQDQLPSMGLGVDLFHHVDEMFRIPIGTGRFTRRLMGHRSIGPREYAREHFTDWRMIFLAETRRGTNALTTEEDAALGRVIRCKDAVLVDRSIGQQVRFVRVGLELAESDHELAVIAGGHLQEVIASISTELEFDMLAHECSLSPPLLTTCREFVSIDQADWNSELKERWHSMLDE